MKLKILFILLFMSAIAKAQVDFFNVEKYRLNVKQPDEFIQRFNGETDKYGDTLSLTIEERQAYILRLFDRHLIQSARGDNSLRSKIESFVKEVTLEEKYLKFASLNWYATVDCIGEFNGEEVELNYVLSTHMDENMISKWVIVGASGEFLKSKEDQDHKKSFISPISHNLNFMKLTTLLNREGDVPKQLAYSGFDENQLSIILFLHRAGLLKIKSIGDIQFDFLDFDNWRFTVKNFIRNEDNAGWLISDIEELPLSSRSFFLKDKLMIDPRYSNDLPIEKKVFVFPFPFFGAKTNER